jgi:hypothetical protein
VPGSWAEEHLSGALHAAPGRVVLRLGDVADLAGTAGNLRDDLRPPGILRQNMAGSTVTSWPRASVLMAVWVLMVVPLVSGLPGRGLRSGYDHQMCGEVERRRTGVLSARGKVRHISRW